ncbi:conserved hypothetical protein [Gloeothece citriformis PCC 7424]|uniref:Uncharacterized protein n=1 Tax=Gloeothece citriformis (strain PCC 7424) TaxID=65393 RepID=B7KH04_GLOC7|nr:P-loop NTPase fold protein [Gloeothece citriformis]ACK73491.1 conserved hypothetical protein [Gloeothece citriformis PCC 7424]
MATLDDIILQEVNPFDPVTFYTRNFWTENHSSFGTIESIHQDTIDEIDETLKEVLKNHLTRSILLDGETGSGKSYLLARLKKQFNSKAFFAYIEPYSSNDHIWRHTLRKTVDSLIYKPEGEQESQLLLWLKSLSAFKNQGLMKKLLGEKGLFIHEFSATYPAGIYQPNQFFSVLYELTQPKNYLWACNWLKGDNIAQEEMKALGVNILIDNEDAARGILINFSIISQATKPIVLCFDQIECAPPLPDGTRDLSAIFQLNTTLNHLKNFLIILSISTQYWKEYKRSVQQSELWRIQKFISLKQINLQQVKALWESRLYPLHLKANPKPNSSIAPLSMEELDQKYQGGKANLRDSLNFGGQLFKSYKKKLINKDRNGDGTSIRLTINSSLEAFLLIWQNEFNKTQKEVKTINQFSAPQLIDMLTKALEVLKIDEIKLKLLNGHYANYSLSYKHPQEGTKIGIIWNEDLNSKSFTNGMKACEKANKEKLSNILILLRHQSLTNPKTKGYQLYEQIFKEHDQNIHFIPNLEDLIYLRTYQRLANDAVAVGIVVAFQVIDLPTLQKFVRETKILEDCQLLNQLRGKIKPSAKDTTPSNPPKTPTKPKPEVPPLFPSIPVEKIKQYLINRVTTEQMLGRVALIQNTKAEFEQVKETEIEKILDEVCQTSIITIVNPKSKPSEQIICWNPQG